MRRPSLLAMLLVAACSRSPDVSADVSAERAAILAADAAWLAAAQSRNVDSALSFWTDDARVIGTGQPPVIGREAIRRMLTDGFATPGFSVNWATTDVVVLPSADAAYSFGTNAFTVPGTAGRLDTLRGQAVVVWRKGGDGRWRSAVDTWTPLPSAR